RGGGRGTAGAGGAPPAGPARSRAPAAVRARPASPAARPPCARRAFAEGRPVSGAMVLRMRGVLKTAVAQALCWSRADALIGRLAEAHSQPLVVGYHRVVDGFGAAAA